MISWLKHIFRSTVVIEVIREVPGPTRVVEVIKEVPGPVMVCDIIKEVPGPERVIEVARVIPGPERIVEVPGPVRVVEKAVPGPERIVTREVPVIREVHRDMTLSPDAEAAAVLLGLLDNYLEKHGALPKDLRQVTEELFPQVPEHIRGQDNAVNRAEMADALQALAIAHAKLKIWLAAP